MLLLGRGCRITQGALAHFKTLDHLRGSEALVLVTDLELAGTVWSDWRDVLEFSGPGSENPLLSDPQCFSRFLRAFRLARSIRAGVSDEFRQFLKSPAFPLEEVTADMTGKSLDVQDDLLRRRFGTMASGSRLKSVSSKIAWVLRPASFPPYDSQSRRGMEHIAGQRGFERYSDYIAAFNELEVSLHDSLDLNGIPRALKRSILSTALARIGRRLKYTYSS
jgi:hypothetical protein